MPASNLPNLVHEPGPGGIAGETAVSPPWLSSLQADLQRLVSQQGSLLHELATCTTSTKQNTACIRTLQTRSEAHEKMHIDVESRIKLEREISELRSRPPSPYTPRGPQTPRGGQGSTTASSTGGRPIDDFQLVIGGFSNAKRSELQAEIREFLWSTSIKRGLCALSSLQYCRI